MSGVIEHGHTCQAYGPIPQAPGLTEFLEHVKSHVHGFGEDLPARFELRLRVDTDTGNFAWQTHLDLDTSHGVFAG